MSYILKIYFFKGTNFEEEKNSFSGLKRFLTIQKYLNKEICT
jgi:hypothetical protein